MRRHRSNHPKRHKNGFKSTLTFETKWTHTIYSIIWIVTLVYVKWTYSSTSNYQVYNNVWNVNNYPKVYSDYLMNKTITERTKSRAVVSAFLSTNNCTFHWLQAAEVFWNKTLLITNSRHHVKPLNQVPFRCNRHLPALAWGPWKPRHRSLRRLCATRIYPSTNRHPCWSPRKVRLGTPTANKVNVLQPYFFPDWRKYLSWHDFSVGSGDVDTGVQAATVVGFYDVTAVDLVCSHTAVVRSLWSWEAVLGPSEGMLVLIQERVLLLNAEPWLLVLAPLHGLIAGLPVVRLGWLLVVFVRLAQNKLVVAKPKRIPVDGDWVQVDIGVRSLSLASAASIKVPDWQF